MRELVARRVLNVVARREPPRAPDAASLLAALPLPVVVLDPANRFHFVNPAAEQFLGVSAAQAHAMRLTDLVPPDNPIFELLRQVRETDVTVSDHDITLESPRLRKAGVAVQGVAMPEEPGSVLLTFQDASAAKALDRQLAFRSAARSVSGMAAILAHEVKNPLSGIRGAAQLLEGSVGEADRELTVLIRDEADRIRGTGRPDGGVQRAADRAHAGQHPPRARPCAPPRAIGLRRRYPLRRGIRSVAARRLGQPRPAGAGGAQPGEERAEAVTAGGEHAAGRGAARSCCRTAFQHGVRLAVPGTDQRVHLPLVVAVRDNGPGIPEDIETHLFDPFVTSKPSGSGLGLALVAKIVADHGGLIEVEAAPGRCEFRLHLPMHAEEAEA